LRIFASSCIQSFQTYIFVLSCVVGEGKKKSDDKKPPTEEDLRSWISGLRGNNKKTDDDTPKEKKDGEEEEDPSMSINWTRIGLIVGGVLAALYLISHEWATEISMQSFISDILSRDIVRQPLDEFFLIFFGRRRLCVVNDE
jgi:hypothetical protein